MSRNLSDVKLRKLINSIPTFGVELYCEAKEEAQKILSARRGTRLARLVSRISGASSKEMPLANSLFDLYLAVFFREVAEYVRDNTVASLLTDALAYQVTGVEAGSVTEQQVLDCRTHDTRGIQKYQVAKKLMPHIRDIEGWTFGSEYSLIISGRPKDFAKVIEGAMFSLSRRVKARAHVRYLLYGTLPTKTEQQAMEQWLKDGTETLKELASRVTAPVNRKTTQ